MTLSPFLSAPLQVQVHVVAALIGLILRAFVLYRPRRDQLHKGLGYAWVVAMAVLALISFAIPSHFTPIGIGPLHGLAVLTLWSLWQGVRYAVVRDFEAHEAVFRSLYSYGLLTAGAFTFLPGRTMNRIAFGEASQLGWLVIGTVLSLVLLRLIASRFDWDVRT